MAGDSEGRGEMENGLVMWLAKVARKGLSKHRRRKKTELNSGTKTWEN